MQFSDLKDTMECFTPGSTKKVLEHLVWYDVHEAPFRLYGFCEEGMQKGHPFCRVPAAVAATVSEKVDILAKETAGGRIRFATDAPFIALACDLGKVNKYYRTLPAIGSAGFDVYRLEENGTQKFVNPLMPATDRSFSDYVTMCSTDSHDLHTYTVNFPFHDQVAKVWIGLPEGATLAEGAPYRNEKPVVFYGSSITQGCCASRPGLTYEARISHAQNLHFLNLGFSGACKAEDAMIDYLTTLDMSVFVCDYDHNAPTPDHLASTLPRVYRAIRRTHPDVPFVFVSSPNPTGRKINHAIVAENYRVAKASGDENVFLVTGEEMFADPEAQDFSIENVHMNDFGFYWMAKAIGKVVKELV